MSTRETIIPRFHPDYDKGYAQGVEKCADASAETIAEYCHNLKSWKFGLNSDRGAFVAGWLAAAADVMARGEGSH